MLYLLRAQDSLRKCGKEVWRMPARVLAGLTAILAAIGGIALCVLGIVSTYDVWSSLTPPATVVAAKALMGVVITFLALGLLYLVSSHRKSEQGDSSLQE